VEHGHDFQASLEHACTLAAERGFAFINSFHELLVHGTATYALEFLEGAPALDRVYVPIGMGSSICGVAAARNALGLKTEIVGVAAARSPSYARSFAERRLVEVPAETEIADGMACRRPDAKALELILENVARMVEVSDKEIVDAMRALFEDTHNVAEGAGAAALAAAMQERDGLRGKRVGLVLTGGNVDRATFAAVLAGGE
jgi:threonine dehydratase